MPAVPDLVPKLDARKGLSPERGAVRGANLRQISARMKVFSEVLSLRKVGRCTSSKKVMYLAFRVSSE